MISTSSLTNREKMIRVPVINTDICGVLNLGFIFPMYSGSILSLARANGYLEADMIPAFADEMIERIKEIKDRGANRKKCAKNGVEYIELPVAYDGLAVICF